MDAEQIAQDLDEVLVTEPQIRQRITELAAEIERDYAAQVAADEPPLFVGVLTGAMYFMADLTRAISFHTEVQWLALSSYGAGTESSGEIKVLKELSVDIRGRDVVAVEDIIDTGLTLEWLINHLDEAGARSVRVCALLRKPDAAKVDVPADYLGFDIANRFVVGYGLDYAERYRNLREIAVLHPGAVRETPENQ